MISLKPLTHFPQFWMVPIVIRLLFHINIYSFTDSPLETISTNKEIANDWLWNVYTFYKSERIWQFWILFLCLGQKIYKKRSTQFVCLLIIFDKMYLNIKCTLKGRTLTSTQLVITQKGKC